jgi:hypothetical protein
MVWLFGSRARGDVVAAARAEIAAAGGEGDADRRRARRRVAIEDLPEVGNGRPGLVAEEAGHADAAGHAQEPTQDDRVPPRRLAVGHLPGAKVPVHVRVEGRAPVPDAAQGSDRGHQLGQGREPRRAARRRSRRGWRRGCSATRSASARSVRRASAPGGAISRSRSCSAGLGRPACSAHAPEGDRTDKAKAEKQPAGRSQMTDTVADPTQAGPRVAAVRRRLAPEACGRAAPRSRFAGGGLWPGWFTSGATECHAPSRPHHRSASSSALASRRSGASKLSVNRP